jgi:hypothetical protein
LWERFSIAITDRSHDPGIVGAIFNRDHRSLPQAHSEILATGKDMSAYSIARQHMDAAQTEAAEAGVDIDTLLRAMLATLAERYRDAMGADDLRAILQYQLDNAQGDEDYMFMRP